MCVQSVYKLCTKCQAPCVIIIKGLPRYTNKMQKTTKIIDIVLKTLLNPFTVDIQEGMSFCSHYNEDVLSTQFFHLPIM